MNKYLVPICDINKSKNKLFIDFAPSRYDFQEKIMDKLINEYNIDETVASYKEFVQLVDSQYDIILGPIEDYDEI